MVHTRWKVPAKRCGNRSPLVHKWRDYLQQNVRATCCSDKSLCVYQRIFVKICLCNRILSLQQVAKNQTRLNLCNLLQRQRFSQKFSNTHEFMLLKLVPLSVPTFRNFFPKGGHVLNSSWKRAHVVWFSQSTVPCKWPLTL